MSMFNIAKFVSEIGQFGVARNDRYVIEFDATPSGSVLFNRAEVEKINSRLESISLPSRSIGSNTIKLQSIDREIPYGNIFEGDIKMSMLDDRKMNIRRMFDRWQGLTISNRTYQISYYDNYTCNMVISLYDEEGNQTYAVKLFNIFPKSLSSIELETSGDNFIKTEVELSYRRWIEWYGTPKPITNDIFESAGSDFNPDFIN